MLVDTRSRMHTWEMKDDQVHVTFYTHVLYMVTCVRQEGVAPEWRFVSADGHACILSLDAQGALVVEKTSDRVWDASKTLSASLAPHDDNLGAMHL